MYTGKERVLQAFAHKKTDRLPVFDVVNKPDMYESILGQSNYESRGRLCVQLARKLGMDAVTVHSAPYTCLIPPKATWDSSNTFTDRFGLPFKVEETSWPLGMIMAHREADEEFLEILKNFPFPLHENKKLLFFPCFS